MKPIVCLLICCACLCLSEPAAALFINELDSDTPGTDEMEFIELYDGGTGHLDLSGYALVLFNGATGKSYATFDLSGYRTNDDGFFLIGSSRLSLLPDLALNNGFLQNGADAAALYQADAGLFPSGTFPTTAGLIDAIVYGTNDPDAIELLTALNLAQQFDEGAAGDKDHHALARIPEGALWPATFAARTPTPGRLNGPAPVPTPEPSTLILTAGGAAVLGLWRRRSRLH